MSSKYPLLNDKDWLYQKYITEGLSTIKITELAGARTPNSARQALIRADIPMRSISDGLTINRIEDGFVMNESVFTGCMLGDATMEVYNRHSDLSYPSFKKKNKYLDHVAYVAELLFPGNGNNRITIDKTRLNGKLFEHYLLRGISHKELLPFHRKWYPEGKKVVPVDIPMNPVVLLHWFMDDGWSRLRNRGYYEILIGLETQGFVLEDVDFLCELTKSAFGLRFKRSRYKSRTTGLDQWRMLLPQTQRRLFYEIIGPSPVPSLSYKWK